MEETAFVAHRDALEGFPVEPSLLYVMLRHKSSDLPVGRRLVAFGLIVAGFEILTAALCWYYGMTEVASVFLVLTAAGIAVAVLGYRRTMTAQKILRRSADAQRELEGEDGFLWRFETILLGLDELPAEEEAETLEETCRHSRSRIPGSTRDSLQHYWYWVSRLKPALRLFAVPEPEPLRPSP